MEEPPVTRAEAVLITSRLFSSVVMAFGSFLKVEVILPHCCAKVNSRLKQMIDIIYEFDTALRTKYYIYMRKYKSKARQLSWKRAAGGWRQHAGHARRLQRVGPVQGIALC